MARMLRALFICSLLVTFSVFAQSADQEMLSAVDSPDPVIPGNNITYTVQVRNNGPDPAVNGGLNMNISGSLTYVSGSGPAGFTCFNLGNNASCTNPSFPAGTTATFTVIASVPASLLNFPDGTATSNFFTSGVTADPNNGNNFLSVTTSYDSPQVDLSLTVADSPDPVFPDGTITYTIPVTNAGPDTATAVNFNSFNNGSLWFQSATVPPGWNCTLPAVNSTATFTCTNPSFAPGTVNFTVVVKAPQSINGINDGTVGIVFGVNGTGNDTNQANNNETENTAYVASDADMTVSVSDSPDPVFPDGNITYTVTVGNAGPDAAPNAKLNLFNNGSLQFQSVTPGAGFACTAPAVNAAPTFTCTNPSFAPGGSVVFTVVAQADATINGINDGTIQTAFSVNSDVSDPNNANSSETESTAYVTPDADISVTNSDSPDPVSPGATITYTQSITNSGPDAANATFSQVLQSSVGFQSLSAPAGWSCTTPAVGASGAINCTFASFASGATANFTLVVTVIANSGIVTNTVTGGSNVQDPDHTDDSATVTTTILAPVIADLGITKSTTSDGAAAGASVAYTITLTNNGPDAAANVVVTDTLPAELLFQSINVPAGFSCTTPAAGATGTITCTAPSMASGTTVVFTLVVKLTANATGPINNTVSATSDTDDDNSGNDSGSAAPVTVGSNGTADLSVDKSTPTTTAAPGDPVTYTISVTNNGPNPANDVIVNDDLPPSLLFQSITPAAGFTCTTPAAGASGTITCLGGPMANGATATFTLVTTIAPSASGSVANGVVVSTSDSDPVSGNSTGASGPVVIATADLSITKTTTATQVPNGSTITYTITVTNNGPDTATNVVVSDNLPAGLQYVNASPSQGSCSGTDPFTCTLGTLLNGASATISLQALVTATSGTVTNTATVTADTDDGTPGNNSSTSPATPVTPAAAQGAAIPTMSEWALLALAMMLGLAAVARMRM
jgi:uncharacterized repeat protein (TIGR01451 family)